MLLLCKLFKCDISIIGASQCKNHAKVDTKSKFINTFVVTGASVRDPQATDNLLEHSDEGQDVHADSAYTGKNQQAVIAKHKMIDKVHELQSNH